MNEFKPRMTKKYKTLLSAINNKEKNLKNIEKICKNLSIDSSKDLPSRYEHAHIHESFFTELLARQNIQMFPSDMLETYRKELSWNRHLTLECEWLNASEELYNEFTELASHIELHDLRTRKIFKVTSYNPNAKRRFEDLVTHTIDGNTFGTLLRIRKKNTTLFIFHKEHVVQQHYGNGYNYSGKWGLMCEFNQINTQAYKRYSR